MDERDTELHSLISVKVDAAVVRLQRWIFGLILGCFVTLLGATFWAGSMHQLVQNIDAKMTALADVTVPALAQRQTDLELQVEHGILPKAERRLGMVEQQLRRLREQLIAAQVLDPDSTE